MAPVRDRAQHESEATMGRVAGDKARFNKERRKKLARRVTARALAKKLRGNEADATPMRGAALTGRAARPEPPRRALQ